MRFLSRSSPQSDTISQNPSTTSGSDSKDDSKNTTIHREDIDAEDNAKWAASKTGDGDVARALFSSPAELHDPIDPAEEARVVRKIDMMILPYLAVCYCFFYIDKTMMSLVWASL